MEYNNEAEVNWIQKVYDNNRNILIQAYNISCEVLDEPKRENEIYKAIESPHKHTYILAYQIAIRNIEVKKILYALRYLKNIRDNYTKDNKIFAEELVSQYPYYLNNEQHDHFLSIGLMRIEDLIDQFEGILRETYLIIPKENKVTTSESNITLIRSIIYNSPELEGEKLIIKEEGYKSKKLEYDDYTITIGILKGEKTYDVGIVRPTFNSHIIENNTLDIPINLNLPTEEIIAFIKKIKENSDLIKSPLELLGEELETIDPANVEQYFPKKFKAKLKTMAHALFTYDKFQYLNIKYKQLKLEKELLIKEERKEKEDYIRPGRRTKIQERNIKRIEAKYKKALEECNKSIDILKKSKKNNYKDIYQETYAAETTVRRYYTFMNKYIKNLKYKKLFIKTKKEPTQKPI